MDPFLEMSQDQIQKLDEVLQSDQAKALLQETTGKLFAANKTVQLASTVRGDDDNVIMNSSMESLSGLSDLENLVLEPSNTPSLFVVPNDEDVVNIASDILHGDLAKPFEIEMVLMDHSYSLPVEVPKANILDVGKRNSDVIVLEGKGEDIDSGESTDTANSPIAVCSSLEHEQLGEVKSENAALEYREQKCAPSDTPTSQAPSAVISHQQRGLKSSFDEALRSEAVSVALKKRELIECISASQNTQEAGQCQQSSIVKKVEEKPESSSFEISAKANVIAGCVKQREFVGSITKKIGSSVKDNIVKCDSSVGSASDPGHRNISVMQNEASCSEAQPEISRNYRSTRARRSQSSTPAVYNEDSSDEKIEIGSLLNRGKTRKRSGKSADKSEGQDTIEKESNFSQDFSRENNCSRKSVSNPCNLEMSKAVPSSQKRFDTNELPNKRGNPSNTRKKSLSISEEKAETKPEVQVKKRSTSVSGKDSVVTVASSSKPKVKKPKKKSSRSDSISADLLGPALFSEPDMMVKVKTDDMSDDKNEKNKNDIKNEKTKSDDRNEMSEPEGKSERSKPSVEIAVSKKQENDETTLKASSPSRENNYESLSELDLIKAEVDLEESESKQKSPDVTQTENQSAVITDSKNFRNRGGRPETKNVSPGTESLADVEKPKAVVQDTSSLAPSEKLLEPKVTRSKRRASGPSVLDSPSTVAAAHIDNKKGSLPDVKSNVSNISECDRDIEQAVTDSSSEHSQQTPLSSKRSKQVEEISKPERKSQRTIKKRKIYEDEPTERTRRKSRNASVNKNNSPKRTQKSTKKDAQLENEEEEMEYSDDPEDSDWDSEDDPEKLWCICRQPHNNKFMIECDKCKDWFHGKCVSVTRQLGRQLEKEGKEWICPNCAKTSKSKGLNMPSKNIQISANKGTRNQVAVTRGKDSSVVIRSSETRSKGQQTASLRAQDEALLQIFSKVKVEKASETLKQKETKNISTAEKTSGALKPKETRNVKAIEKVPETLNEKEIKSLKASEKPARSAIPKNFILKSRDPIKRENLERNKSGNILLKAENPVVKAEEPITVSENLSTRSTKNIAKGTKVIGKTEALSVKTESASANVEKPKATVAHEKESKNVKAEACEEKFLGREVMVLKDEVAQERRIIATKKIVPAVSVEKKPVIPEKPAADISKNIKDTVAKTRRRSSSSTLKVEKEPLKKKTEIFVKDRKAQQAKRKFNCISCAKPAPLGSVYCSHTCLEKYAAESVKIIQNSTKANEDINTKRVVVIDHQTGNLSTGVNAPVVAELVEYLKSNPSCEVVRPSALPVVKKEQQQKPEKSESSERAEDSENSGVRTNVRKTLKAILIERSKDEKDMKMKEDEIAKIAVKIEEELHKCFKDQSPKYRAKYRSLMFNIKDPRNKGLFRKILKGKIPPDKLVRMSPEELASRELTKWREKANQHSLDMIKRMQIEQQQTSAGVRKKTHKGEIEIEEDVAVGLEQEIEKDLLKTPPRQPEETIEVTPEKKEEKETEKDTTSSHRSHLFDLNCKICTGKMAPPPPDDPTPKKVRVAHSISVEHNSPKVTEPLEKTFTGSVDSQPAVSLGETSDDSIDKEPSSTTHSSPDSSTVVRKLDTRPQASVWKGFIFMQDVEKFVTCAYKVSGPTDFLNQDIPDTIQVCGRIVPDQVWEYLTKVKHSGNKELTIIRFRPANDEEFSAYNKFYTYLNSRKRYGVVNNCSKMVKDFYILPLAAHCPVPTVLMPFDGPGLPSRRPHLLLGVLVRHRSKLTGAASQLQTMGIKDKDDKCSYGSTENQSFTPPIEDHSYTPPLEDLSYSPPKEDCSYTPPLEDNFQSHSAEDESYTPPPDDRSFTPPLPERSEVSSTIQAYNPTRWKNKVHERIDAPRNGTPPYIPQAIETSALKRPADESEDAYEPSYTPPLEKMPRRQELLRADQKDDMKPYDPEQMVSPVMCGTTEAAAARGRSALDVIMKHISESGASSSHSSVVTAVTSPTGLEKQRRLLSELTRKCEEVDLQTYKSINALKQLGATSSDVKEIDLCSPSTIDAEDDSIGSINPSGMTTFLNLPQNLQNIINSVRQKPPAGGNFGQEAKGDVDIRVISEPKVDTDIRHFPNSETDTDIRQLHNFLPIDRSDAGASGRSPFDGDERSSSQGCTPPLPCEDENSSFSELRPSDPRIKIRTTFEDDQYPSDSGVQKTSLSDMSMSELVERAEKELAAIESPSSNQIDPTSSQSGIADHFSSQCWESHKEPPPPGIEPPDMLPVDNVAFSSATVIPNSSTTQSNVIYSSQASLPEGHVIGPLHPSFAPQAPAVFPTHLPPPVFPLHAQNVNPTPQPPVLPAAFLPPPVPSHIVPPPQDTADPSDERYLAWPPEGAQQDLDYPERPPHWDEQDWRDWDRASSADYYPDQERDEWYQARRQSRDFYPEDHPAAGAWSEDNWEYRRSAYGRRGNRRWYSRNVRGHRRDGSWRGGRRRAFPRPHRD